jgi:hypothetical protein
VAKKARTPKPPRTSGSGNNRQVQAPQRRAGSSRKPPATASTTARYRYFWPTAAAIVALVIVGVALGIALTRSSSSGPSKQAPLALKKPIVWSNLPGLQTTPPPWPNNSTSLTLRLPSLGLNQLSQEQLAFHIHQHLDIFVNGKHVTVPQEIGFGLDPSTGQPQYITELHTHNALGIVHVESAEQLRYQLGQFFGEWGVRLTGQCLGNFDGGCDHLEWYVNGVRHIGNPAKLVLENHQEIAIVVGTPPAKIPSSYDFASHGV